MSCPPDRLYLPCGLNQYVCSPFQGYGSYGRACNHASSYAGSICTPIRGEPVYTFKNPCSNSGLRGYCPTTTNGQT